MQKSFGSIKCGNWSEVAKFIFKSLNYNILKLKTPKIAFSEAHSRNCIQKSNGSEKCKNKANIATFAIKPSSSLAKVAKMCLSIDSEYFQPKKVYYW